MRKGRPLGATYTGLLVLGSAGGIGLALTSAAMLLFRTQAEPIVRIVLPLLVPGRGIYQYDPDSYFLYASFAGILALMWVTLMIAAALRKPTEDRHIDSALIARLREQARGAPLEPR